MWKLIKKKIYYRMSIFNVPDVIKIVKEYCTIFEIFLYFHEEPIIYYYDEIREEFNDLLNEEKDINCLKYVIDKIKVGFKYSNNILKLINYDIRICNNLELIKEYHNNELTQCMEVIRKIDKMVETKQYKDINKFLDEMIRMTNDNICIILKFRGDVHVDNQNDLEDKICEETLVKIMNNNDSKNFFTVNLNDINEEKNDIKIIIKSNTLLWKYVNLIRKKDYLTLLLINLIMYGAYNIFEEIVNQDIEYGKKVLTECLDIVIGQGNMIGINYLFEKNNLQNRYTPEQLGTMIYRLVNDTMKHGYIKAMEYVMRNDNTQIPIILDYGLQEHNLMILKCVLERKLPELERPSSHGVIKYKNNLWINDAIILDLIKHISTHNNDQERIYEMLRYLLQNDMPYHKQSRYLTPEIEELILRSEYNLNAIEKITLDNFFKIRESYDDMIYSGREIKKAVEIKDLTIINMLLKHNCPFRNEEEKKKLLKEINEFKLRMKCNIVLRKAEQHMIRANEYYDELNEKNKNYVNITVLGTVCIMGFMLGHILGRRYS